MLERKPAVMITAAINSTNLLPCLKQATRRRHPGGRSRRQSRPRRSPTKAGVKIAFTHRLGQRRGRRAGRGVPGRASSARTPTGPVLVIEGLSGNITGQKRAQGFADKLAELAPGLEIVASLPGDWDRAKAANITNDILTRNPDLVGDLRRQRHHGARRGRDRLSPPARASEIVDDRRRRQCPTRSKSIKAGRLNASVAQLPYLVGKQAVEKVERGAGRQGGREVPVRPDPGADQGSARRRHRADARVREVVQPARSGRRAGAAGPPSKLAMQRHGLRAARRSGAARALASSALHVRLESLVVLVVLIAAMAILSPYFLSRLATSSTSCSRPRRSACWRSARPTSSARPGSTCRSARCWALPAWSARSRSTSWACPGRSAIARLPRWPARSAA